MILFTLYAYVSYMAYCLRNRKALISSRKLNKFPAFGGKLLIYDTFQRVNNTGGIPSKLFQIDRVAWPPNVFDAY